MSNPAERESGEHQVKTETRARTNTPFIQHLLELNLWNRRLLLGCTYEIHPVDADYAP